MIKSKLFASCTLVFLVFTVMIASLSISVDAESVYSGLAWTGTTSTASQDIFVGDDLDATLSVSGAGSYSYEVILVKTSGGRVSQTIDSDSISYGSSEGFSDSYTYNIGDHITEEESYLLYSVVIGSDGASERLSLRITAELDSDGDRVSDDLDLCEGYDDSIDIDSDGFPDHCDKPSFAFGTFRNDISTTEGSTTYTSYTANTGDGDGSEQLDFVVSHDIFSDEFRFVSWALDEFESVDLGQNVGITITPELDFVDHDNFPDLEDEFEVSIIVFEDNDLDGNLDRGSELYQEYSVTVTVTDYNQDTTVDSSSCDFEAAEGEISSLEIYASEEDSDDILFRTDASEPRFVSLENSEDADGSVFVVADLEGEYDTYDTSSGASNEYSFWIVAEDYYPGTTDLAMRSRRDAGGILCTITVVDSSLGLGLNLPNDQDVGEETVFEDVGSYVNLDSGDYSLITVTMTDSDGTSMLMNDDLVGGLEFYWEVPDESQGIYTISVEAIDTSGLSTSDSFTLTVNENDIEDDPIEEEEIIEEDHHVEDDGPVVEYDFDETEDDDPIIEEGSVIEDDIEEEFFDEGPVMEDDIHDFEEEELIIEEELIAEEGSVIEDDIVEDDLVDEDPVIVPLEEIQNIELVAPIVFDVIEIIFNVILDEVIFLENDEVLDEPVIPVSMRADETLEVIVEGPNALSEQEDNNDVVPNTNEEPVIEIISSTSSGTEQLKFSSIGYDTRHAHAGERLYFSINMENEGPYDLEDMQVSITVLDFSQRVTSSEFDLEVGAQVTQGLWLYVPNYVHSREYDIKITASNDDDQFVAYREFRIS